MAKKNSAASTAKKTRRRTFFLCNSRRRSSWVQKIEYRIINTPERKIKNEIAKLTVARALGEHETHFPDNARKSAICSTGGEKKLEKYANTPNNTRSTPKRASGTFF